MALADGCATVDEARGDRGLTEIGAGHRRAEVEQHLGDAAHADATDADEMDALNLGKHAREIGRLVSGHDFTRAGKNTLGLALSAAKCPQGLKPVHRTLSCGTSKDVP